jgi:AraC-like DNA-binding protein/predicted nucleic acid-binding protein
MEEKKQKLELKINSGIEKSTPSMTVVEYERLKQSIKEYGLKIPIEVMSDGTIIDGHHRYKACKELGIEPTYHINKDVTTIEQAKELARELNDSRRQMNLPRRILCAYQTYKEKLEQEAKERQLSQLKQYANDRCIPGNTTEKGRTVEKLAKQLGVSPSTLQRSFKIIEKAPSEYFQMWLDGVLPTKTIAIAVEALDSIPEEYEEQKKELIQWTLEDPEERIPEVKKIVRDTNVVLYMLEQEESEEVRKQIEQKFKSQYYTPELNPEEVLWFIEEISGSSHKLSKGIKLASEIGETWEEADAWFAHFGGRCIREVKAWEGEWDKYQEQLEKKGKFQIEDRSDDS